MKTAQFKFFLHHFNECLELVLHLKSISTIFNGIINLLANHIHIHRMQTKFYTLDYLPNICNIVGGQVVDFKEKTIQILHIPTVSVSYCISEVY